MAEGKGLLDFISSPAGQGLLAAGFGALAGRGTRAQAIGQGGLAGLLAYGQATDGQRQAERQRMMDERQNEMFGWQRSAYQQQQDAARKAQEQQAAQQTYLGSLGKITSPRVDAQPNQADPRQMLGLGFSPDFISTYMNAGNLGKAKIKDFKEVRNADGSVTVTGFDEFGNVVNTKQTPFKAPDVRDFGGYVGGIDPITGNVSNYGQKTMSAAERDASARGWASNAIARERLSMDKGVSVADAGGPGQAPLVRQFGKAPPGYRWKQDGSVEAIPGGPVDLKAGEAGVKSQMRRQAAEAQLGNVLGAVNDAKSLVGPTTAGVGSVLANVPGTSARDLQAKLETVKANLGFDRLQQMRDMSPTGGALGAVAVQELTALQSTVSSLDAGQSPDQLRRSLEKIERHYKKWADTVKAGSAPAAPNGAGGAKFLGFE